MLLVRLLLPPHADTRCCCCCRYPTTCKQRGKLTQGSTICCSENYIVHVILQEILVVLQEGPDAEVVNL